jgi:sterol 22-desaturase
MVIPSFYNSLHDPAVYPEPDVLDPDRWQDSEGLANANPKSYLVWGSGPHRCIAPEYATLTMAMTLAIACMMFDFEHDVTPLSNEVELVHILTLMCQLTDVCLLGLSRRYSPRTGVASN